MAIQKLVFGHERSSRVLAWQVLLNPLIGEELHIVIVQQMSLNLPWAQVYFPLKTPVMMLIVRKLQY
ncbi:hypothetical protein H5410_043688 [Solanum commersonii]|uniref:Uncharacterized protein n=1 Tax=Solanum commersonii TaxID=4109 RepID=A0A9J5Y224_SOLCO|nr:hypothetical protein H5410_043688 [Solanum commersonii]